MVRSNEKIIINQYFIIESKKAPLVMKIPKDVLHQKKRKESKDKPRDERKEKKRPKIDYPPPPTHQRFFRFKCF